MDSKNYREILGHFATGVTVIIAEIAGSIHGMTANSFTSVSLDPPLILFAVDHQARMRRAISQNRALTISILKDTQKSLSLLFAQPNPASDPFEGLHLQRAQNGIPYLADALAFLAVRIAEVYSQGDHDLVICRVEELKVLSHDGPLLFFRGRYYAVDGAPP